MSRLRASLCFIALTLAPVVAMAREEYFLYLQDHLFSPARLEVPAGKKIIVKVVNRDHSPEEFESFPLNREKVILGNSTATLYLGPLDPGEYPFFGDFHPDSAQGVLIAVPEKGVENAD